MAFLKNVKSRWNDDLSRLTWQEFECLIADYYQALGYKVQHVGTAASATQFDGGIDIKLFKENEYIVVQCKHWNARQVTHNSVHELIGVMTTESASSAIIITSGEFTSAAVQAEKKTGRIELIDGAEIRRRLLKAGILISSKITEQNFGFEQVEPRDSMRNNQSESPVHLKNDWKEKRIKAKRGQKNVLNQLIFRIGMPLLFLFLAYKLLPNFVAGVLQRPQITAPVTTEQPATQRTMPVVRSSATAVPSKPVTAEIQAADQAMDAQELREWKKRNEESMKLLEESTPEL